MWLDPLRAALDEAPRRRPSSFATTTPDGTTSACSRCSTSFERHGLPLDVAVIPRALSAELARVRWLERERRMGRAAGPAPARSRPPSTTSPTAASASSVLRAIATRSGAISPRAASCSTRCCPGSPSRCSRHRGTDAPRHRASCSRARASACSRGTSSEPVLALAGLIELPVSVDWSYAKRDGRRLTFDRARRAGRASACGSASRSGSTCITR